MKIQKQSSENKIAVMKFYCYFFNNLCDQKEKYTSLER